MEIYFLLVSIDRPLEESKYTNQTFIPQNSKACVVFINILMSKTLCLQKNANFLKSYKKEEKVQPTKPTLKDMYSYGLVLGTFYHTTPSEMQHRYNC